MAMGSHTPATGGPALYTPTATAPSALAMPQSSLAAAASPDLDSTPLPDPMSQWFSGQDGEFGLDASGLLPGVRGDGEDLPVWNGERFGDQLRAIPGADLVISWVQRDAYTAFVAATAGCFVLLLVAMALLKAL